MPVISIFRVDQSAWIRFYPKVKVMPISTEYPVNGKRDYYIIIVIEYKLAFD